MKSWSGLLIPKRKKTHEKKNKKLKKTGRKEACKTEVLVMAHLLSQHFVSRELSAVDRRTALKGSAKR